MRPATGPDAAGIETSVPGTGIRFKRGGLHATLGVDPSKKIPPAKMNAALRGEYGPKAKREANLAQTLEGMAKPKRQGEK